MSEKLEQALSQMLRIADAARIDRESISAAAYRHLLAELVAKGYVVEGKTMDEVEQIVAVPPTQPAKT